MEIVHVAVAGVTGWTGSAVATAVAAATDLELTAGIARTTAGKPLSEVVPGARAGVDGSSGLHVTGTVAEALAADHVDVLVDYTSAASVRGHVETALAHGVHVVVGSSGLSATDYAEIDSAARAAGVGVVAAGNYSLLAALLLRCAEQIAAHVPDREVLDFAGATKRDVPSGTARELAERLESFPAPTRPSQPVLGPAEARGATIAGTPVHSLRLPGYTLSTEIVFAREGERLSLRHDPGDSPASYVAGTLLAIRKVSTLRGLTRGLDRLLDLPPQGPTG